MDAGNQWLTHWHVWSSGRRHRRLPVHEGEKVFVWMTRAADADDWALRWSACRNTPAWRALEPRWRDAQERAPQILRLRPGVAPAPR